MTLISDARRYSADSATFSAPNTLTFHTLCPSPPAFVTFPPDAVRMFRVNLVYSESNEQITAKERLERLRGLVQELPAQADRGDPMDQLAELDSYATSIIEAENLQR